MLDARPLVGEAFETSLDEEAVVCESLEIKALEDVSKALVAITLEDGADKEVVALESKLLEEGALALDELRYD